MTASAPSSGCSWTPNCMCSTSLAAAYRRQDNRGLESRWRGEGVAARSNLDEVARTTSVHGSRSAEINQGLDQPVVDGDAHWLESVPVFHEYVRATGGQRMLDDYIRTQAAAD